MESVRQAESSDRAAVTVTVASAFANDPAWRFLFADEYDELAPQFAGVLFDRRVGCGDVWVTCDLASVAIWDPPEADGASSAATEHVWDMYRALGRAPVWQRLSEYQHAIDAARPSTPYWYLAVLATRPDRQCEGLATAVMAHVLERADGDGIDCCLETSNTDNRNFYERRGFTEASAVHIASGPPTWWLRRAPALS